MVIKDREKFGLSGSTLKIIAIIAMFIDHIGAVILEKAILNVEFKELALAGEKGYFFQQSLMDGSLYNIYYITRNIGRIGFPIFCFLLIEGFLHTHNRRNYIYRLGIFALISEIPFNLGIAGHISAVKYQNVFFTLFIGMIMMQGMEMIIQNKKLNKVKQTIASIVIIGIAVVGAELLRTDYGANGIISILVLYVFHNHKIKQILIGALTFVWELPAVVAFIPLAFYNGKRGLSMKYVFYLFYPIHLLCLYGIARYIGAM